MKPLSGWAPMEATAMAKRVTGIAAIPPAPSLFMTASEVARSLRIGRRTLDDLVAAGAVPPPIRLSRKTLRWTRASVEAIGGAA